MLIRLSSSFQRNNSPFKQQYGSSFACRHSWSTTSASLQAAASCCSLRGYAPPKQRPLSLYRSLHMYIWLTDQTQDALIIRTKLKLQVPGPALRRLAKADALESWSIAFLSLAGYTSLSAATCCAMAARAAQCSPPSSSLCFCNWLWSHLSCARAFKLRYLYSYCSSAQLHDCPHAPLPCPSLQGCSSPLPPPALHACFKVF